MQKVKLNAYTIHKLMTGLQKIDNLYFKHWMSYAGRRIDKSDTKLVAEQNAEVLSAQEAHINNFVSLLLNDVKDLYEVDFTTYRHNSDSVHIFKPHEGHAGFKDEITENELLAAIATDFALTMKDERLDEFVSALDVDFLLFDLSRDLIDLFTMVFDDPAELKTRFGLILAKSTFEIKEICGGN